MTATIIQKRYHCLSTIVKWNVEEAIRNKRIDLLEFTAGCPEYHAFYSRPLSKRKWKPRQTAIDLADISDDFLLRQLIEFADFCMDPEKRKINVFHKHIVLGMAHLLEKLPASAKKSYDEFFKATEQDNLNGYMRVSRRCANLFHEYCNRIDQRKHPFSGDIIYLDDFQIAPERINDTTLRSKLCLSFIRNQENKKLVQQYVKYLLLSTDRSISTISTTICSLTTILNCNEKPYIEWTPQDAEQVVSELQLKEYKRETLAKKMIVYYKFAEYLLLHDVIKDDPLKKYHDLTKVGPYHYKATAENRYVIVQIFNVLDKLSEISMAICFLIIYCTGMRISEACGIKKDCLEAPVNNPGHYFIRFYQKKMKKNVFNAIPPALYNLIADYRMTLPEETDYLFPGRRPSHPFQAAAFSDNLNDEFLALGVKETDGQPYHFTAHSFRHLMAVRMRDEDIPFQYIQEQLHHGSPEMTMAYVEFLDRQKIAQMKEFIDNNGDLAPVGETGIRIADDAEYAEYMRKFINAQMLPDGICNRPVILGKCPHCNACLSCNEWRTSVEFLDIHKNHLARIRAYVKAAKEQGWIMQLHEAEQTEKQLSKVITSLEKIERNAR